MIRTYSRLNNFQYDAVIALRPDTAMLRDIDLPKVGVVVDATLSVTHPTLIPTPLTTHSNPTYNTPQHLHEIRADSTAIWIPSFQHWGGLNDRGGIT